MTQSDKIGILSSGLYCITDEQHSRGRSNLEVVRLMLDSGVRIIQYREKEKAKLGKFNDCRTLRDLTAQKNALFIVNDDVDIAMAVEADGVHIGQDDMPIEAVRSLTGSNTIIGLSTHSPQQAQDAVRRGADYIGVGPVFRTFTKKDVCEPVGFEYLDYAVENVTIPFVAIGGIKEHNLPDVAAHGAKTVCLVTEITEAEDIPAMIGKIFRILNPSFG